MALRSSLLAVLASTSLALAGQLAAQEWERPPECTVRDEATLEGRNWWFHLRVGDLELRTGRLRAAERAFREGLAVEPGDHRLWSGLARVEAARGRWRRVLEHAARAGGRADLATLALTGDAHAALGDPVKAEEAYAAVETGYAENPEPYAPCAPAPSTSAAARGPAPG